MCGIVGVLCAEGQPAVAMLYEALLALQHRGQDAAGIVTEDCGKLSLRKDNGMVRDVFTSDAISGLSGDAGIGHVRYPTAGSSCSAEAQPFYVNSPFGITLAHNGNLVNCDRLVGELAEVGPPPAGAPAPFRAAPLSVPPLSPPPRPRPPSAPPASARPAPPRADLPPSPPPRALRSGGTSTRAPTRRCSSTSSPPSSSSRSARAPVTPPPRRSSQ